LGGDEFILVLPEFTATTVKELLPRVELAVEEAGEAICCKKVVTASVGAAFYPKDGLTAEELLSEADRSMYEAKENHYRERGAPSLPQIVVSSNG
jgi:diguanylate cyclase (GGDEF)-like protein